MKLAIFTDIHGNLEALKTIINDIKSKNVDEIICLGDTIGLGSESKECLDLIIENNIKMVLGNHELCALYGTDIDSSINSNVQRQHYKWIRESLTINTSNRHAAPTGRSAAIECDTFPATVTMPAVH